MIFAAVSAWFWYIPLDLAKLQYEYHNCDQGAAKIEYVLVEYQQYNAFCVDLRLSWRRRWGRELPLPRIPWSRLNVAKLQYEHTQNIFDLCSSLFLVITFTLKLCNIHLTGALGYWLCMILLSENLLWSSINGSQINLLCITVERYLKVVHHTWSKKVLRRWVKISAAAFAWISGVVYNTALVFSTSNVVDGVCYAYVLFSSRLAAVAHGVWNFISFFGGVIFIFVFCYGHILVVIRRQARVMAGHSGPGTSATAQNQSQQIQSSVIKTMITVSVFYVITWMPSYVHYLLMHFDSSLSMLTAAYYVPLFMAFFYISANPFIYATKFDPVKRVLVGLIPWKTSQQPTAATSGTHTVRVRTTREC